MRTSSWGQEDLWLERVLAQGGLWNGLVAWDQWEQSKGEHDVKQKEDQQGTGEAGDLGPREQEEECGVHWG